jgi:hypothetical protein
MTRLLKILLLTPCLLFLFADTAHANIGQFTVIGLVSAFGICIVLITISYYFLVKSPLGRIGIIVLGILLFLGPYLLIANTINLQKEAPSGTSESNLDVIGSVLRMDGGDRLS